MSGRRGGNRIRGPQSALTDFLAANNISAAQIRDDYERRRQSAQQNVPTDATSPSADAVTTVQPRDNEDNENEHDEQHETSSAAINKKRKRSVKEAAEKAKKAKASAVKHAPEKKKKSGQSDDDEWDDSGVARDMYKKARPAPGQFEHCEVCNKRFTVTAYSKEGPDGGLLCTPCGKDLAKEQKHQEKKATAPKAGRKRRKLESDRLDGIAIGGAKSLQDLCISAVAQHHEDIDELGDLPQSMLEKLSQIFSKRRVLKPKTLPLFLRADLDAIVIHDAAYLEESDYHQIFAVVPRLEKLVLANACQFKDAAVEYMLERCTSLKHVQLYAANLVTNEMWHRFINALGPRLEVLKLKWLDAAFEDAAVQNILTQCPNLKRLKFALCRRIGEDAVLAISKMPSLEHLSLQLNKDVSIETLLQLVSRRGPQLRTLSLVRFLDADDSVIASIHEHCAQLRKLRISHNDTISDAAYAALFTNWANPPLTYADFSSTRDINNSDPDGPPEAIGLASAGLQALMNHSGSTLRHLDISSCRHISLSAFMDVFNGAREYPILEYLDVSFCVRVDNSVVAGIFKSCPALKQLVAFSCFSVQDIVVPRRITLIGAPRAQDAIEQYGVGIGVDEAIGRMVEAAA